MCEAWWDPEDGVELSSRSSWDQSPGQSLGDARQGREGGMVVVREAGRGEWGQGPGRRGEEGGGKS